MSPTFTRPLLAAALAAATPAHAEGPRVTQLPAVPDAYGFAGAFAGVDQELLIAGGGANFPDGVMPWDGGKKVWHDRLFALDLATPGSAWKEIGKLPEPVGYGVSLTLPEGILLIGGGNASAHFTAVHLLKLAEGKPVYQTMPALPVPLAQMAAALTGRQVHLCGGIDKPDATSASAGHWMLDLDAREKGWQQLPPLPGAGRILATAAGVGDAFILAGGCSLAPDPAGKPLRTYLREAWKYSGHEWTRLADLPRAATAAASPAPVQGHSLFIISGDDGTQTGLASPADHPGFTRQILRYDVERDQWSEAGQLDFPAPVTLPTAPWQDGFILFNGEVKPGQRTPRVFQFNPGP